MSIDLEMEKAALQKQPFLVMLGFIEHHASFFSSLVLMHTV